MKRYNWLRTHEMFQESDKISNNIETQKKEQSNVLPNNHSYDHSYSWKQIVLQLTIVN